MNPKTLITYIEKTRADMQACVERLSDVAQHPINRPPITNDASTDAANILDATLAAQLATAMEHVLAVNNAGTVNRSRREAPDVESADAGVVDLHPDDYKEVDK